METDKTKSVYIKFIKPYELSKGLIITLGSGILQPNGDVISEHKTFNKNDELIIKHKRYKKDLFNVIFWLEPEKEKGYYNVVGKNNNIDYRGTLQNYLHHFNWRNVAS